MAKLKPKSGNIMTGGCLSLFGMPFLCAGLVMAGMYFNGFSSWWRAQGWEEVPCWIESAKLKENQGDDSTSYQATATYRYEFRGRQYHGDRVAFGLGSDNVGDFQKSAHRELAQHVVQGTDHAEAVGREGNRQPFHCYVNPSHPEEAVLYRGIRWEMQAFLAIFALTFPAVGAGLVVGGILSVRYAKREASLKQSYPDEPWKWKSAWSGPAIPENSGVSFKPVLIYTLWSGAIIFPLIAVTAMTGAFDKEPKSWLLMIFVALWCLPAWFTFRRLRQKRVIGSPKFELAEVPAYPGGILMGSILLEKPLPLHGSAELTLLCEKLTTVSTGDGNSTSTDTLWTDSGTVSQDLVTRDGSGFRLPVRFPLPPDSPVSGESDTPSVRHRWKLRFQVPESGIKSEFELPVFRMGKSPAPTATGPSFVPTIAELADQDIPALLASQRIRAEFDRRGFPISIHCPPARFPALIVFLVIFDLIWSGIAVVLFQQNALLIFQIFWPASAAVIWGVVIYQLIHSRTLHFNETGLEVTNRFGPIIRTESITKNQIIGFSHDTNASSNNTSFYRVRIEDVFGKTKTLVGGLKGSMTAAALARRLEDWWKSGR